jgi:hypothetical protein
LGWLWFGVEVHPILYKDLVQKQDQVVKQVLKNANKKPDELQYTLEDYKALLDTEKEKTKDKDKKKKRKKSKSKKRRVEVPSD